MMLTISGINGEATRRHRERERLRICAAFALEKKCGDAALGSVKQWTDQAR